MNMRYRRTQKHTEPGRGEDPDFNNRKPGRQAARTEELSVSPVELISPGHRGSRCEGIVTGGGGTTRLLEKRVSRFLTQEEERLTERLLVGQSSRGKRLEETRCRGGESFSSHISFHSPFRFPRALSTGRGANNIKAQPETTPVNPTKSCRGVPVDHLSSMKPLSSNGITRDSRVAEGAVPPGATRITMPPRATRRPAERGTRLGMWSFSRSGLWLFLLLFSGCTHMLNAQDVAPYFRVSPGGVQTHLERNRLVLTCLAEGSWPLQYRWMLNNTDITPFSTVYTYMVPEVLRSDAGLYQCVVRNRVGALVQRRAEVQVAFMSDFSGDEQRRTVTLGRAAVLNMPALSSFPRPQVTWYRDGHKIIPSNRVAISLDNQLVVLATSAADAGRYYVQAVNELTGQNHTSPSVVLNMTDPNAPFDPSAPVIVIAPKNTSVVSGREATLECIANARPVERLVLSWKRNGRRLASGVGVFGRRLTLFSPSLSDGGVYVCEASLINSTTRPAEARVHLTVLEAPYFTAEPKWKTVTEVDKNVDIHCLAKGVPSARIEWFKDAVPLSKLANPRYKVTAATGLTIRRVQPADAGMFQCFAQNAAGEAQTYTQLVVTSVSPSFALRPSDLTVTDGNSAIFTCETSGAPKPAVSWWKGSQLMASGTVQTPRFTLLESGGLLIQPVRMQDSGDHTCAAVSKDSSINATATLTVWSRTFISVPPLDQRVIKGTTATLHCNATHDPRVNISFQWLRGAVPLQASGGRVSISSGTLTISQTWSGDIGDYTCTVTSQAGNESRSARLEVIELPHSPRSLSVSLNDSDSRSVLLSWVRPFDGNSPLLRYILELSENNSPWKVYMSELEPAVTQVSVGGLTPARTYQFRLCAVNQVGRGQYSSETQRLMLREEAPSAPPKNIVASGRTNQSIMLNGLLRGYVLRYRLAGLPGDYQEKNITSPETNYCLLSDLIIWTQYQIQLAAYTAAGLGEYSTAVNEYTLQGVPTAPPQNVEVTAVNSSALRFTWNPPPQQFINGINQGYKLLVWPEHSPGDVTVVTITPDYPGARLGGFIVGLRKFTWYFGSALCFTTPGDGPKSSPTLVQTHEDEPGPVGHLSFTEILDTSLRVSWAEPNDRNGIITGYVIMWCVSGSEVNVSCEERLLSNSTLHYKVTGLTSMTSYTLKVAAMTAAGRGVVTISTISSGVPPELPGAPSNLVISNISPRSATLKFLPGSDGKTPISKWIVEGQVSKGESEEEWRVLYERENREKDVNMLEIPDLLPFTQYRFRMRQVNIVGSSPSSAPSRMIQTLQAAPDTPPKNLTLVTATQTRLSLRWAPLPASEYNGSPETIGYRVCARRAYGRGEERLEEVVGGEVSGVGGQNREVILEGLAEWTEYHIKVQAFNSIGAGPWSNTLTAHTKESVPSGSPVNVSAEAMSSTQLLVTWSPVPDMQRNGPILGYKVNYSVKDSGEPPSVRSVPGERSSSVLLGDLLKYTLYEVRVIAYTALGDGPPSPPCRHWTKDDVPGPPVRLLFSEVGLTSVKVVWQPPQHPNGVIMGYQIAYRLDSADPMRFTTVEVGSTARQFTVSGLTGDQAYVFKVTARTAQGWGRAEEAMVITTERRERPSPPKKLFVPQGEVRSRRLRLHWIAGASGSSPLRYYSLQTRELPKGDWTTHSADIPHNNTSWTVERLKPFTSYKLRMMASNDVGDSNYSRETDTVTTLQDVPEEAPVILAVKPSTTTSVLVQWQSPNEGSVNGVLVGFRLYYRELLVNSTPTTVPPGAMATSNKNTSLTSFKTVSSATLTEFELTQLKRFKRYEIFMTAYNIIGESPPSEPATLYVGEAAPSLPPESIRVLPLSPNLLEVTWDLPPPHTHNGLIQGYKVHYWQRDYQNQTEKVTVVFVPDTRVRLANLTCYTPYLVTLSAFNAAGDGPPSEPRSAKTLQAAPSQPSFLLFSEVTGWSVNVSWGAPSAPNGVVEGYRVVYQPTQPVQGVSRVVAVDVKGSWQRWLKVRDLTKGVTYTFSVQARTVSYGPAILSNITAQPLQGTPGSPMEMSITKSSTALTLHWSEGDAGAGPVIGYVIEARPSDEGIWDSFIRLLPPSSRSVTVEMDRLRSGVGYEFRVIAVNHYGYGEPSTPSASLADRPFYEEWWFLLVISLVGLMMVLMLVFTLLLHGQNRKSCTSGKQVSTVEDSVTLDNGGFTALELNSRTLNSRSSFLKKNGTRSPPRPSPGGLHYSDEDLCNNYNNGAVLTDSTTIEKPTDMSGSEVTDSDYEDDQHPKHSFVNHYMSDPTYYNSWKRQPKGLKGLSPPYAYEECASADAEPYYQTVVTQHSAGGAYTPAGLPAHTHTLPHTHGNPGTNPPGSRTPITGFSSFV
uniref:Sidekick cell adhesion molecule 1a n=1 Tax=Esox lucius TaxID=8010 RepID=A0A6Q2ZJC6_ESOLU